MNPFTFEIKDDQGNVIHTGYVRKYTVNHSINGTKWEWEGIQMLPNVVVNQNNNITKIRDSAVTVSKLACPHKWVEYKGFTDAYEFCDLCGVKR